MKKSRPAPLAGCTVVITGAGSGIGRALAERLSAYGCPVAAADVGAEGLAETEAHLNGPAFVRPLDVRDRQGLLAFAAEVAEWAPAPVGAVFNNAGVAMTATIAQTPPEDHEWVISVNFDGVVNGTQAFLPILLRQGSGAIVNTSSVFGLIGVPYQSAYCASKFAVRGFTESLRHELRGTGVRAVTIHPGGVRTNIAHAARMHEDPFGEDRPPQQIADEFMALVRTTPERAAEVIHRGVDAGKARILIGADARFLDALVRTAPSAYFDVVEPLLLGARRLQRRWG